MATAKRGELSCITPSPANPSALTVQYLADTIANQVPYHVMKWITSSFLAPFSLNSKFMMSSFSYSSHRTTKMTSSSGKKDV
jgi:hypothetical protein